MASTEGSREEMHKGIESISGTGPKVKRRLSAQPILCLSPLSKPLRISIVQLRRVGPRGLKSSRTKRQRTPFSPPRLKLVGPDRPSSAFLVRK